MAHVGTLLKLTLAVQRRPTYLPLEPGRGRDAAAVAMSRNLIPSLEASEVRSVVASAAVA